MACTFWRKLTLILLIILSGVECDGKPCSNRQVDFLIKCSIGRTVFAKDLCSCAAESSSLTKLVIIGNEDLKRLPEVLPKDLTRLIIGSAFVTKLEIKNNPNLTELPEGLLDNLTRLAKLTIRVNPKLTELPEGLLKNLTNLKELDLQQNSLSVAPNVDHMTNLLELTLAFNPIPTLPENYLKSNTRLTLFKATGMNLTEVPKDLFKTTTQMRNLHLDVNNIKTLAPDIFQNLESLRSLNLADNFLSSLSVTIFKDLGSLQYLDLSRINLSTIVVQTFSPIRSNLKELKLSGNRLEEFNLTWAATFPNITKLELGKNQISANITEDQLLDFAQKVTLDLTGNARVRLILNEAFAKCDDVSKVTLKLSETDLVEDCFKTKLMDDLKKGRGRCIKLPAKSKTWKAGNKTCPFPYGDLIPDKCTTGCNCSFNVISKESVVDCSDNGTISFDSGIPHVRNKTSSIQVVLSRNGITDLESIFRGVHLNTLNKIGKLDLSENEISRINASDLPQNLTYLYLNNNALSEVNEEVIDFFENNLKMGVKLGGNKFACTCQSIKLISFLKTTSSKVLDIEDIIFDCDSSEKFSDEEGSHTEDRVCPKLGKIALLVTAVILCLLLLCLVILILRKKEMIWLRVSSPPRIIFHNTFILSYHYILNLILF